MAIASPADHLVDRLASLPDWDSRFALVDVWQQMSGEEMPRRYDAGAGKA